MIEAQTPAVDVRTQHGEIDIEAAAPGIELELPHPEDNNTGSRIWNGS